MAQSHLSPAERYLLNRQYRENNLDHIKERCRKWQKENPEKRRMAYQRRRARIHHLPATLTEAEWKKIKSDHFGACHYCGKKSDVLHQEHVVPVLSGGAYSADNIVPACHRCNAMKGTKNYKQFTKSLGNTLQGELTL